MSAPALEILTPGLLNTVQDLGRFGLRRFGVGTAGAMDTLALRVGNLLLGNPEDMAGIEVQVFPFALRITADTHIAVTGADCRARLDDTVLPPWWATQARTGQILHLDPPTVGARSYITVTGGIDVPVVLGSRSTYLRGTLGGQQGRALVAGDILPVGMSSPLTVMAGRVPAIGASSADPKTARTALADPLPVMAGEDPPSTPYPNHPPITLGAMPPHLALPTAGQGTTLTVRVLRAGEYDRFDATSQQRFWTTPWRITPQSDRGGYRLAGPSLTLLEPIEMRSHGVMPGVIQVPPAGEPIIQMSDANTAGGYPKIAGVIEADLWRLGQARLGSQLRFIEVTYADAVAALDEIRRYLDQLRRMASLQRESAHRIAGQRPQA